MERVLSVLFVLLLTGLIEVFGDSIGTAPIHPDRGSVTKNLHSAVNKAITSQPQHQRTWKDEEPQLSKPANASADPDRVSKSEETRRQQLESRLTDANNTAFEKNHPQPANDTSTIANETSSSRQTNPPRTEQSTVPAVTESSQVTCSTEESNSIDAGRTWNDLAAIASTRFSCEGRPQGYYADQENSCKVFHYCNGGNAMVSFMCPACTLFHQERQLCDFWYTVECRTF